MIQEMVDSASRVVVLADSAKFERRALALICPLSRIDALVSDQPPGDGPAHALERAGVTLAGPYLPVRRADAPLSISRLTEIDIGSVS